VIILSISIGADQGVALIRGAHDGRGVAPIAVRADVANEVEQHHQVAVRSTTIWLPIVWALLPGSRIGFTAS
jgi:hypothetical protein